MSDYPDWEMQQQNRICVAVLVFLLAVGYAVYKWLVCA